MKKGIIYSIIGAVLVIGVGAYLIFGRDNGNDTNGSVTEQSDASTVEENSVNGLLAQGKDISCTYEQTDDAGNRSQGTVYVSGKQMRGDFTLSGDTNISSHMIRKGDIQYVWQEGSDQGYKTDTSKLTQTEQNQDSATADSDKTVDADKKYNYKCDSWNVDNNKFDLPSGVQFTDLSEQINAASETADGLKQQQAVACDNLPDPTAKQACLDAINN